MKHKLHTWWLAVKHFLHTHKRTVRIILAILVILTGAAVVFLVTRQPEEVNRSELTSEVAEEEVPVIVPSPLTGLSIEEELANRPVTAFMVENSPEARPQSGLDAAGVVVESIAEGGITRFMALYQEAAPDTIGPIRSLRPYYIDWALAFDASLAHVGGSPQALQEARQLNVKDLDQFAHGGAYYRSPNRFAPHNVYTGFDRIDPLNEQLGFNNSNFDPWPRKDGEPLTTPKAASISIPISSFLYNPEFNWNAAANTYTRSQAGQPHIDQASNSPITVEALIVVRTGVSIVSGGYYSYDLIGSGNATIFQDGDALAATWRKPDRSAMMTFEDANGDPININRGQVWISVIRSTDSPEYTP